MLQVDHAKLNEKPDVTEPADVESCRENTGKMHQDQDVCKQVSLASNDNSRPTPFPVCENPGQVFGEKRFRGNRKPVKSVPQEAYPDLIRFVNGKHVSIRIISREFQEFWDRRENKISESSYSISKSQIEKTIREISVYERRAGFSRCHWYVKEEVKKKYNMPVPNQWKWGTVNHANEAAETTGCVNNVMLTEDSSTPDKQCTDSWLVPTRHAPTVETVPLEFNLAIPSTVNCEVKDSANHIPTLSTPSIVPASKSLTKEEVEEEEEELTIVGFDPPNKSLTQSSSVLKAGQKRKSSDQFPYKDNHQDQSKRRRTYLKSALDLIQNEVFNSISSLTQGTDAIKFNTKLNNLGVALQCLKNSIS